MHRLPRLAAFLGAALLTASAAEPIRLHPKNPHYFEFRGKPVALVSSGEHYGAVINATFDYRRYLETLSADGLNYTRLFVGSYVEIPARSFGIQRNDLAPEAGRFIAPWARTSTAGYEGGGNKFDLEQWNPEFFERYRNFLSEAAKRGIVVEVTLFSSHYQEAHWKVSPFNPSNNVNATEAVDWEMLHTLRNGNILAWQERYARKLVRAANAFDNVIFEIQNEPWSDRPRLASVVNPYLQAPARDRFPNSIEVADELSMAWQARVAEWVTSEEASLPHKHLIAQNYANFGIPVGELAPGVSIVNFHYAYPFAVDSNYGLAKAIGYDETGFLGRDDDTYCRQAWNFLLSGGSLFNNLDYSFSAGHEDGSDTEPNGPGGGSTELRRRLGILSRFLNSLPLPDLAPDSRTAKHAAGVYARVLSTPGGEYAMYFDGNGPSVITLELPPGDYFGEWIDVEKGSVTPLSGFRHAGGEKVIQKPEFRNGIALRLSRRPK
ncbi:MAG TPA: hypothetical protein VLY04_10000 [Bryobacteraceae bacterium]|nr:hypothetical protein [Bryobacteraceae bacterium]